MAFSLMSSKIDLDDSIRFYGQKKANGQPCLISFGGEDYNGFIRRPSVLLQRVTSNDQPRRLVAAAVPKSLLDAYGGFVGENHTVILEQIDSEPALTPRQLAQLLGTSVVERHFRCISGSTNVSAFELSQLPLPDPALLKRL